MGLIKAALGATGSVLGDQWREYFHCEAMPADVLISKGSKRTSSRSSNRRGSDNIISNGSVIAVNEGQCMMIVQQGQIVEFTAEPGEFTWDASTEPTIFYGGFGNGLEKSWNTLKKRFTFGGDPGNDQRVYFFNTKEIVGNRFGTPSPVPFRVVDHNIGMDLTVSIRCNGEYSYKITDPMLFYKNVSGNVSDVYTRDSLDGQLNSEFMTALQPAFAQISEIGIRYTELPGHTVELADAMNRALTAKWHDLRGISVISVGINSVTASPEDEATIKDLQKNAIFRDPSMAAAHLVGAQAVAMQSAAKNEGAGPAMAFMGMNMAGQAGGANAQSLYQQAAAQQTVPQAAPATGWTCICGQTGNTGKFCTNCGKSKPVSSAGWTCPTCGTVNKGKFCSNCGAKKPDSEPLYRCDKCGWEPDDPAHPPKFCPECGDPFDDRDIKK